MSTVQDPTQFTTEDLQDLEFLEAVEETLEERGWTTDAFFLRGGSVCLVGAGMIVANGGEIPPRYARQDMMTRVEHRLRLLLSLPCSVMVWNDHHARGRHEVLQSLQAARTRILQKAGCPSARKARV